MTIRSDRVQRAFLEATNTTFAHLPNIVVLLLLLVYSNNTRPLGGDEAGSHRTTSAGGGCCINGTNKDTAQATALNSTAALLGEVMPSAAIHRVKQRALTPERHPKEAHPRGVGSIDTQQKHLMGSVFFVFEHALSRHVSWLS